MLCCWRTLQNFLESGRNRPAERRRPLVDLRTGTLDARSGHEFEGGSCARGKEIVGFRGVDSDVEMGTVVLFRLAKIGLLSYSFSTRFVMRRTPLLRLL